MQTSTIYRLTCIYQMRSAAIGPTLLNSRVLAPILSEYYTSCQGRIYLDGLLCPCAALWWEPRPPYSQVKGMNFVWSPLIQESGRFSTQTGATARVGGAYYTKSISNIIYPVQNYLNDHLNFFLFSHSKLCWFNWWWGPLIGGAPCAATHVAHA